MHYVWIAVLLFYNDGSYGMLRVGEYSREEACKTASADLKDIYQGEMEFGKYDSVHIHDIKCIPVLKE